jgi:hypothetical protein
VRAEAALGHVEQGEALRDDIVRNAPAAFARVFVARPQSEG